MTDYVAKGRQLLAEALLIAEAPAAGFNEPTSHSKPDSQLLSRKGASTFAEVRWALNHTGQSARERYENAEKVLLAARQRKRPTVDCQTRDGRLQVGKEARDLTDAGTQGKDAIALVAWRYSYTTAHVYKLRAEYDLVTATLKRSA